MTQTAPDTERIEAAKSALEVPAASDGVPSAPNHRWWRIGWGKRTDGSDAFALIGIRSTVVWPGSINVVPCARPYDANHDTCPCSLHAPATSIDKARSLSSIVVGGHIRVLASHAGPTQPDVTVAAIEGPLRLLAWCDGAQDGFTLDRCRRTPRLVVPSAGTVTAFCRRHFRRLPRKLRADARPLKTVRHQLADALARYGVDVVLDDGAPSPHPARGNLPAEHRSTDSAARTQGLESQAY